MCAKHLPHQQGSKCFIRAQSLSARISPWTGKLSTTGVAGAAEAGTAPPASGNSEFASFRARFVPILVQAGYCQRRKPDCWAWAGDGEQKLSNWGRVQNTTVPEKFDNCTLSDFFALFTHVLRTSSCKQPSHLQAKPIYVAWPFDLVSTECVVCNVQ